MKEFSIKKILVPLDFSRLSLNALYHAEKIAEVSGASITLLHVIKPFVDAIGTSGMLATAMRLEQHMQLEFAKRLQKITLTAMKRTPVKMNTKVVIGPVATIIKRTAEKISADMIIMGTHGASGFFNNLLGSNTYRVTTLSKLPVLCVHKRPSKNGYRTLIFPVRTSTEVMRKFTPTLLLAKMFNTTIHVVGLTSTNTKEDITEMRRLCTTISEKFIRNGFTVTIAYTVDDPFSDAIIHYAQKQANSLVVILQEHDFNLAEVFGGTFSKKVLHQALSPVLAIPV